MKIYLIFFFVCLLVFASFLSSYSTKDQFATWDDDKTYVGGTLLQSCFGEACKACKNCRVLTEKFFDALVKTRMALLWSAAPKMGLIQAIKDAKKKADSPLPIISHYTLASTHLMLMKDNLPPEATEDWYLHCENLVTRCKGQRTPECRCHPLFDLSLARGVNFDMSHRVTPNPVSVNEKEPFNYAFRQNWQAFKEAKVFKEEPFESKSLDMLIYTWSYALIEDGKSYLAKPVENDYAGRVKYGKAYLEVLRKHLPPGTLVLANGGQSEMSLGRFLPTYESENVPEVFKAQPVAINGKVVPEFWNWWVKNFQIPKSPVHPEWWNHVGKYLDGTGADGWVVFPFPEGKGKYSSFRYADDLWKDSVNFAVKAIQANMIVGLMSDGGDPLDRGEDLLTRNFSIGSFLLVRAKKTGYAYVSISYIPEFLFIPDLAPAVFFPAEIDIPLGKPLSHAKKTIDDLKVSKSWEGFEIQGGFLYARKFENGAVFVNPSSKETVTLNVPQNTPHRVTFKGAAYLNTSGEVKEFPKHPRMVCTRQVSEASLPPTSALVFLRKPIESSIGCPEPW